MLENSAVDGRAFRDTLGRSATGITIIAGRVEGEPAGFTCQSFYSVSCDPPLVSFPCDEDVDELAPDPGD